MTLLRNALLAMGFVSALPIAALAAASEKCAVQAQAPSLIHVESGTNAAVSRVEIQQCRSGYFLALIKKEENHDSEVVDRVRIKTPGKFEKWQFDQGRCTVTGREDIDKVNKAILARFDKASGTTTNTIEELWALDAKSEWMRQNPDLIHCPQLTR
jgi:hypothetical protein